MLYIGLSVMALGVSGIKANLASHGADQLDPVIHGQQIITSFFNGFFFCLCTGGMLAVTILVWIQVNRGWKLSMILCTIFLFLAIFIYSLGFKYYKHKVPGGSPFTRIFKVTTNLFMFNIYTYFYIWWSYYIYIYTHAYIYIYICR